jgi:Tfp pilus assembly protein PilO
MFKSMTYQRKLQLLIPAAILALLLVYLFGLKKTFATRNDIQQKKEKLALSKDINAKMGLVKSRLNSIDNMIGQKPDSSKKVIDNILEDVTTYCNSEGCILKAIPETHHAEDKNFSIETYFITVEGNYKKLLNLVYLLEQKKKGGGRLSSCILYTRKNNQTKKLSLESTLFIQQYDKKNETNH